MLFRSCLAFDARVVLQDAAVGDSIAVSGCCVTVVDCGHGWWAADAVEETMQRTTFGELHIGDPVNFERSVRLYNRMGGHLVQGHVDGVGRIVARTVNSDESVLMYIQMPRAIRGYVVEKGGIAVDGVSLTVVEVDNGSFSVALVPHTQQVTTLGRKRTGDAVNLEADLVAKYVERLVRGAQPAP